MLKYIEKYRENANSFKNIASYNALIKNGDLSKAKDFGTLRDSLKDLKVNEAAQRLDSLNLNPNLSAEILTAAQNGELLSGSTKEIAAGIERVTASSRGVNGLGTAFSGVASALGMSTKALGIFAGGLGAIAAVGIGYSIYNAYQQDLQQAVDNAKTASNELNNKNMSLDSQIAKVRELKEALTSGTLSEQEAYQTKSQLLSIQQQLAESYGSQASGIDLVNGSLEKEIALMNELAAQDSSDYLNQNQKGINKATKEMEKTRYYTLGSLGGMLSDSVSDIQVQKIADEFENIGLAFEGSSWKLKFTGDASQANEEINSFMNKIRELKNEREADGKDTSLLDDILLQSSKSLSKNQEILDEYGAVYTASLQADMFSKGFGEDKPATVMAEYTDAVAKYNEALLSGDTTAIASAKAAFDEVQSSVDSVLEKYPEYQSLFDEVGDSLNTSAVHAQNLKDALSSGELDNALSQLKDLKEADLKEIDFTDDTDSNGEAALKSIVDKALKLEFIPDDSEESIGKVIDMLVELGYTGTQSATLLNASFQQTSSSLIKAAESAGRLKAIMAESSSGNGLSADSLKAFREIYGDDAERALERTANGYHINREALAELQRQQDAMTETDYLNGLSEQYTALRQIEEQLAEAQLFEKDTSALEASRSEIISNISSLEDLKLQYEAAASAYSQWQAAMSGGEEGDMYDSIFGNIDNAKELRKQGLTGTNKFREFTDLISNKDLSEASNEEVIAAYDEALPQIERYFTGGQEGVNRFWEDVHQLNDEWAKMNEDGLWEINLGENDIAELAEKYKIDEEAIEAIARKSSDYGYDVDFEEQVESMDSLKAKAEEAQTSLSDIGTNLDENTLSGVDEQMDIVNDYIDSLGDSELEPEVRTEKLEAANTILEYLLAQKQELGQSEGIEFDVDTGSYNDGIEKLSGLKEALSNMHGSVGLDYQGFQSEANYYLEQIESLSPEVKVALGIQGMSTEEIKAGLMDGSIKIPVKAETSQTKTDVEFIDDKSITVTANTALATLSLGTLFLNKAIYNAHNIRKFLNS